MRSIRQCDNIFFIRFVWRLGQLFVHLSLTVKSVIIEWMKRIDVSAVHDGVVTVSDVTSAPATAPVAAPSIWRMAAVSGGRWRWTWVLLAVHLVTLLYYYFTEVAFETVDKYRVPGSANLLKPTYRSLPAYEYAWTLGSLPASLLLATIPLILVKLAVRRQQDASAVVKLTTQPRVAAQIIGGVLFIGILTVALTMSHFKLFCAYPLEDFSEMCDIVGDIMEIMDRKISVGDVPASAKRVPGGVMLCASKIPSPVEDGKGVPPIWPYNGSLLAIVRNQSASNYFIENDHDLDFCGASWIFEEDWLKNILISKNLIFSARNHENGLGNQKYEILLPGRKLYHYHSNYPSIDIDECPIPPLEAPDGGEGLKRRHRMRSSNDQVRFSRLPGCNRKHFWVMQNYKAYFEEEYGSTWRTPLDVNNKGLCRISRKL